MNPSDQIAHVLVDRRIDGLRKDEFNNVFIEKRPFPDRDNPARARFMAHIRSWGDSEGGRFRRDTERLPFFDEMPDSGDDMPGKHGGGRSINERFILHVVSSDLNKHCRYYHNHENMMVMSLISVIRTIYSAILDKVKTFCPSLFKLLALGLNICL